MVFVAADYDLRIENRNIKSKTPYKYFGVTLTSYGKNGTDVQNNITRGKVIIQ